MTLEQIIVQDTRMCNEEGKNCPHYNDRLSITTLSSTLNAILTEYFGRINSVTQPRNFPRRHPHSSINTLNKTACYAPNFSNSSPSPTSPPSIPITPSLPTRDKSRLTYGKDMTLYSPAWISTAPRTSPRLLPFQRQYKSR